jgi:hypothetical protein
MWVLSVTLAEVTAAASVKPVKFAVMFGMSNQGI